jgi:hypothetical protein
MEYESFQTTDLPSDPVKIQSGSSQDETWELVPVGSLKVKIFLNTPNTLHTKKNTPKNCATFAISGYLIEAAVTK